MKNLLVIITISIFSFTLLAQNKPKPSEEKVKSEVKNIIITEKTLLNLTNRSVNKSKLSKIADRKSGKYNFADDPIRRKEFEFNQLKNPLTGKIPKNIKLLEKRYVLSAKSKLQSDLKADELTYQISGPRNVGGRTRALATDISDASGNTILAGGVTGGMWKSTNRGVSWIRTTNLDEHPSVTAIAQDPRSGSQNIWYYTTGEYLGSASEDGAFYAGNGIFKSTNNGDTWDLLPSTAENTFASFDRFFDICWNICVDPNNGDVYVATYGAIYVSTNGGTTWTRELESFNTTDPNYAPYTDVICTPEGTKYASISSGGDKNGGIWRKSSGSASWENISPENFPTSYDRIVLAHAPSNTTKDIVYLLARTSGDGFQDHSFWKLTYDVAATNPASWEDRSQNLPERGEGDRDVNGYNSQNSYNMVIKVSPSNENVVFIGGTNLFRSDDAFVTKASPVSDGITNNSNTYWIGGYAAENDVSQYDEHHADLHALTFIDANTLLSGHDGGISITNNFMQTNDSGIEDDNENTPENNKPVDWELLNNGYLTTQSYTIAIDHDNVDRTTLISGFQDNGTWVADNANATTDWIRWGSGDGSFCSIINNGNTIISSSQNGTSYLEDNVYDEDNYYFTRIDPEGAEGQLFINPFIIDANNHKLMYYAAGQFIWRNLNIYEIPKLSNDKATVNWEKLDISEATGTVSALATSTYPANILYYGTSNGKVYRIDNANSTNAERVEITGSNMPEGNVVSIAVNPLNGDEVLVAFSNYKVESLFHSTNKGGAWTAVSGNLEENENPQGDGPSVRSVSIMPTPTSNLYFAGTSTGLYKTGNLNTNPIIWTQESENLIGTSISAMVKSRRDGFVAIGTHGNGAFTGNIDFSNSPPKALIGIENNQLQTNESTNFISRSIGDGINSWNWTFEGGSPSNSTEKNPTNISYNQEGTFSVSLTVANSIGEDTQTITTAINVGGQPVGIDDNITDNSIEDLRIYPNPMVDQSTVKFPNQKNKQYRLIVIDANGKVVRIIENITGNNVIINREQLKPGVHIINLSGEKIYKGKLLVK